MHPASRTPPALPDLVGLTRPRLRPEVPLLWRTCDSVQIGDHVRVTDVTRADVAWVTSLDGASRCEAIEESLTIAPEQANRLVRALLAAGALDDAARVHESVRWAVGDERDDARRRLAAAVSTYRALDAAHEAVSRRERVRVAVMGSGALARQTADALTAGGVHVDTSHPDFLVLADALHPDVPVRVDDGRDHRPHLHVGVHAERATVGPLVVPGRTSCLRCGTLHRTDADPSWPLVSVQWTQALEPLAVTALDPLLVRWAAARAALLVRCWIELPDQPDLWGERAVDLLLPSASVTERSCPPHPLCGCRWTCP